MSKLEKTNSLADQVIEKLSKAVPAQGASTRRPVNGLVGWSQDPKTGALHHSAHGIVSTFKTPNGVDVKHGGKTIGSYRDIASAGAGIKDYISKLVPGATGMAHPNNVQPIAKEEVKKAWAQHKPFPKGERPDLEKPTVRNEEVMADQLAALLLNKSILGPTPPPQPTDEEMFGRFVVTEEQVAKAEKEWDNSLNSFFEEASKPFSSRFASEEEEAAYWASIKIQE